jgi:hypothetical protein
MTQEATPVGGEAAPVEPTTNPEDVFTKLAEEEFGFKDEEEQEPAEGEVAEEADDETDIEEEVDDLPPIEAPVSWDAEAKAKFAELPRDVQEIVQKREADRERFVQQKSQEATRARQEVEQAALQQLAAYEAQVSQQLEQYAQSIVPQRPDASLIATNPYEYAAQQQKYEEAIAQRQQAQQTALQYAQQAQMRDHAAEQARLAQEHQTIVENFPEYTDPTTGPKLRAELSAVAKELGYTDELIGQARASDILAMRKAAEWKADAAKYRALQGKKMEKVRAAKGLPKVATPGVSQGTEQLRARSAQAALDTALTSKNRDVSGAAFYQYLEKTGQVK